MDRPLGYRSPIAVLLSFVTAVACGGGTTDTASTDGGASSDASGSGDGGKTDASDAAGGDGTTTLDAGGRVPVNHRTDDSQCQQTAPAGNCTITIGTGNCLNDAACTMGTNGRCVQTTHGAQRCSCSYDTCTHDTDCVAGKLCVCHGSTHTAGAGNSCVDGNCRVDADCGAGKYCSPSYGTGGCGTVTGYYCHGASDACTDDSDCTEGGLQVCAWSGTNNRWECQGQQLCP